MLEDMLGLWGAEMQREFSPTLAKSAKRGLISQLQSQIWCSFWKTKYAESMGDMFWMLYPVLGLLGAKGGRWGAEM